MERLEPLLVRLAEPLRRLPAHMLALTKALQPMEATPAFLSCSLGEAYDLMTNEL